MSKYAPSKQVVRDNRGQPIPVTRTASVPSLEEGTVAAAIAEVENVGRPPSTLPTSDPNQKKEKETKPKHPKFHRVVEITDIWASMGTDDKFLKPTDTYKLMDLWFQPISCVPVVNVSGVVSKTTLCVTFRELISGTHLKYRTASYRFMCDDLLRMLYLVEMMQRENADPNYEREPFNTWTSKRISDCIAVTLRQECSQDYTILCEFLLGRCGYNLGERSNFQIWLRKSLCHSYKCGGITIARYDNPNVFKWKSDRGAFEYVIEARVFAMPKDMVSDLDGEIVEVPLSQDPLATFPNPDELKRPRN